MSKRTIFMETTSIKPKKTIAEIQMVLRDYGTRQIMTDYNIDGSVASVSFTMEIESALVPFKLPADHKPLLAMAQRGETKYLKRNDEEQARRIAWRQILRWVQAQMAMVEIGMVTADQVFMPYIVIDAKGTTLYQQMISRGMGQYQLTDGG